MPVSVSAKITKLVWKIRYSALCTGGERRDKGDRHLQILETVIQIINIFPVYELTLPVAVDEVEIFAVLL